ncbi:MAG TPA: ABC transporter substrate-binding protein [Burkholderiaceae bacterium]|nr:ABC transporter substrate-binding protein [Burkholderiaceae bacterium]
MSRRHFIGIAASAAIAATLPFAASAQQAQGKPIRVGFPMILSGAGALFGEPTVRGAQMLVEEVNAKGGVLGRPLQLIVRDTKGQADEAVRVTRELILKDNVDFVVGTLTSAEGPAVSPIARENKVVFIAPITKTDMLTAPQNLHPYVFRTASTTTTEGRSAAQVMAQWKDIKRVGTISYDYAYGQDVTRAFVEHLKKLRPDIEIVDQQWPKLGEQDYSPFINAQLARKPDAVFSSLWGGGFLTFAQQARAVKFFEALNHRFVGAGEAGSIETARTMGADYPVGIWANSYDVFNWADGPQSHKDWVDRVRKFTKEEHPSSWPLVGYMAMQALVAGIQKANSVDSERVSKALRGISYDTPLGKQTIREKDHNANRGQFWGKMVKDPKYPFPVMTEIKYVDPLPLMD